MKATAETAAQRERRAFGSLDGWNKLISSCRLPGEDASALAEDQGDDDREGAPSNLADLIALRKLRQSIKKQGIDLERLNAGNSKKKKKRKQPEEEEQSYGLQSRGGPANDADRSVCALL